MADVKKIATYTGVGIAGFIGVVLLFALLFALATAFTAVVVWLIWNVLNLHELIGVGEDLTFWQVVAVAAGINLLRSIFSRNASASATATVPPRSRY